MSGVDTNSRDADRRGYLFVRADLEGFAQRGWLAMLAGRSEGLSADAGWSFKTFEVFVCRDGARVLQVQISGTQIITTAYAGAIEVQITATQRITKTYYSAGSQLIAMRQYTTPTSSVLYFLHSDHLGSVSVTTCGANCGTAGTVVARQKFDAWGNLRTDGGTTGIMPTDVAFTGQRENLEIGLHYFKARYYVPGLGRFLSADTMVPSPANPQSLNRFSYTRNNPLKYIDPSGHVECDDETYTGGCTQDTRPMMKAHKQYGALCGAGSTGCESNIEGVVTVLETLGSVLLEPVDWILSGRDCLGGDCSGVLLGLIPFVPGSARKLFNGFENAGDFARTVENAGDVTKAVTNLHHPIPKFLGGDVDQVLAPLSQSIHKEFHSLLQQNLKKAGLPLNVGGRGGSAADWARLFNANPGTQQIALDVVLDTSRAIDYNHGTEITHYVWQNVVDGRFQSLP